jgi:hypothetical protein
MALKIDNQNNVLQFVETAQPAGNPPTGHAYVYVKSDGRIYVKDDAGTETQPGITEIVADTTPVLGGNLNVNDYSIVGKPAEDASSAGNNINLVASDGGATTGIGGDVNITAGGASGVAQVGGDVNITGGSSTLSTGGTDGYVGLINPASATDGSEIRFFELAANGTNYISLKVAASLPQTRSFYLPTNQPIDGYFLKMGAGDQAEWAEVATVFTEDASANIFAGTSAGSNLDPTATGNFLVGTSAGFNVTTGDDNVAIGVSSWTYATTAGRAVAIGKEALRGVTGQGITGLHNIGIGFRAGYLMTTTSSDNVIVGCSAGDALGAVTDNALFGYGAFGAATAGDNNVAIGSLTGSNVTGTATGNVLIGYQAGPTTIGAITNKLFIHNAASDTPLIHGDFATPKITINGDLEVTGTVIGAGGLFAEDTDNNIIGGTGAGANLTATSALNNFIAGVNAGATFTTGDENVIIGNEAFQYPQVGSTRNVVLGFQANQGQSGDSTNMSQSVVIGDQAQRYYNGTGNNVAIGYQAAVGNGTARSTATLQVNIGYVAGQYNHSSQSVAVGFGAMQSVSGAPVTGAGNIAIGSAALSGIQGTAAGNVGIGQSVGTGLDTGDNNVFIGAECGDNITTGDANVCVGYSAGPSTNQSNKLYINNASSDAPLIGGDFSADSVEFNAKKVEQISTAYSNAREITYVLTNTTSNDTQTNLYLNGTGATDQIAIPDDSSWLVEVKIVGKDTGGTRDAYYRHTFACQRSSGFSQQRGTVAKETFSEFSASYDSSVFVNNTSDILEVRVVGDSVIEMDWVATVRITEIVAPT